jgi:uncharacterized protein (TIGR02145 family)
MRQKDLKYFGDIQSGRMNSDDSPFAITPNEWVNAQNVRTGTTDKGATGVVESVGGNVEIPKPSNLASVIIGDQKWSAQNLDVTHYSDNTEIPEITDQTTWDSIGYGAWCWYNFDIATGIKLYNWYAVNDPRGLAPQGWWIPTLYEWQQLSSYLGGDIVSGGHLKETGTDHWNSPNTDADNSSAFTALGCGFNIGGFGAILETGIFWTATQNASSITNAQSVYLRYDSGELYYDNSNKQNGFSVRAITFNSQYITIGSIEDTENNRFIYFNYDQNRNQQASIANILLEATAIPFDNAILTTDSRASLLKNGDNIIITSGAYAGNYTISSIINSQGAYRIELLYFTSVNATYTTDIIYTIGGQDAIICMYTDTKIQYNVLLSSQVIGGLNFNKNSLIHSAHIANNILSFPDGINNEPRKINIESGIKANYPAFVTDSHAYLYPIDFSQITLIKPTAIYPPSILKNTIGSENFIFNDSFQFAYQYQYYDNETTVIGMYSVSSRINGKDETYNNITTKMSFNNIIPDNVKTINLIARGSDTNYAFIAKSWNKKNIDDLNDIENHNNQIGQLTYDFNNTITGIVIAESDVLRPFDNVPIYSQTHEIAKQRYFLANNIDGYNTPLSTSMELSIGSYVQPSSTSQSSKLYLFRFGDISGTIYAYAAWVMYLPWATNPGWYLINGSDNLILGSPPVPFTFPLPLIPAPSTISLAALTYKGATINEYITNTKPSGTYATPSIVQTIYNRTIPVTSTTQPYYNAFPQISSYKSGIAFYDFAMRKCSVVTNSNCVVTTPQRDYNYTSAVDSFAWVLNNTFAQTEIPDWAYYYAPIITKNQTKRFFIESFTNSAKYASRDASGNYVYNNTFTAANTVALALPIDALNQAGLGYVYSDGDICILTKSDDTYSTLPVIGQDNNYILIKPTDLGTLTSVNFVYEIYTQYKTSEQEPFYEVGQIFQILNPKTSSRTYSQLSGYFNADAYIFQRIFNTIGYISSAMSPNDLYYKNWYTDTGKVNVISRLGQVNNNTEIIWSDTYISGTQINGSSTFRLGSQIFVSDDCGSITKLQNTSKVQDQGSVMLALCTTETNSMYLGETQILDSTGATQFFSAGTNVIGTINILKGNYGCIDPASVIQYRGNVYYLDASNGRWVQYSANGLDNISAIKMTRFWKNWCYKYLSLTKDEIEAFGNRPYVFATVDPSHDELLISIPKLSNTPPKGFLPDYPSIVYPFDILDYQGKTISYKLGTGAVVTPHWQSSFMFNTEYFCTIQNRLFTFKQGNAWEHNQDNQNEFFGVYSPSQIMFTSNILPQMPKVYDNFLSESNIVPNFVYFYNNYPYLQTSDLDLTSFKDLEGIWYANILRNKVVPTNSGDVYTGLLTAEVMRNTNMYILAEFSPTSSPLQLRILELGMSISKGHTV